MAKYKIQPTDRIMAIDPGVTCGFATWEPETSSSLARWWQWESKPTLDKFLQNIIDFYPDIIVCEDFVHTQRNNVDYTPIKFIAMAEWWTERKGIHLEMQTPAFGKAFFNDDKLKRINRYTKGKPHAMDATRHLYQYMMVHGMFDLTQLK